MRCGTGGDSGCGGGGTRGGNSSGDCEGGDCGGRMMSGGSRSGGSGGMSEGTPGGVCATGACPSPIPDATHACFTMSGALENAVPQNPHDLKPARKFLPLQGEGRFVTQRN